MLTYLQGFKTVQSHDLRRWILFCQPYPCHSMSCTPSEWRRKHSQQHADVTTCLSALKQNTYEAGTAADTSDCRLLCMPLGRGRLRPRRPGDRLVPEEGHQGDVWGWSDLYQVQQQPSPSQVRVQVLKCTDCIFLCATSVVLSRCADMCFWVY